MVFSILHASSALFFVLVLLQAALVHSQAPTYEPIAEDDYSCATANQAKQAAEFPDWNYSPYGIRDGLQPFKLTWEPILEPVPGCNGLPAGQYKQFLFRVVLDKSWVDYYNSNKFFFAQQGYDTLELSPLVLFDRVNYLFSQQFGVRTAVSRVVPLPLLQDACATNDGLAEGDTLDTNTQMQLAAADMAPTEQEAGVIRLGVGSLQPSVWCHSYAGAGICDTNSTTVSMWAPFNWLGQLDNQASLKLAHEIAHLFNICPNVLEHCVDGHVQKEVSDLNVRDTDGATGARPEGVFYKFMTECTPVYGHVICGTLRNTPSTCAQDISLS